LLGVLLILLAAILPNRPAGAGGVGGPLPDRPFLGYHESWWEIPATGPAATRLAAIPGYVNIVALSFARPDMTYAGALEIGTTGLQYP
ncbi:hypothetical protein ABTL79_19335, partial [Acinetobacter baumannii]